MKRFCHCLLDLFWDSTWSH